MEFNDKGEYRVNFRYLPVAGDFDEWVELPLKLLVMGDFTLRPDERSLEDREPINIDKDNFNEVLKEQNIGIDVTVPNKLSGEPDEEMNVKLKFESIKDFSPEAIVRNIPELNRHLELREALTALKGPLSNIPEFRKKLQEIATNEEVKEQLLKELGLEKE